MLNEASEGCRNCPFAARRYLLVWDLRLSKRGGLRLERRQNTANRDIEDWSFADNFLDRSDVTVPAILLLKPTTKRLDL